MNVLLIRPRLLTVKECEQVSVFASCCRYDADDSIDGDKFECEELSHQPAIIQEWYSEWLRDDHYPLSPVNKDHADDLWLKFCEEVGR